MQKEFKISTYIALFIVLLIGVTINIFPILANSPITPYEESILSIVKQIKFSNIEIIFNNYAGNDNIIKAYAYIVNLLLELTNGSNVLFWLRFPSAVLTAILTLCLFRFDGSSEKLGNSFISSLVFMACTFISALCYKATPILIPGVLTILSLVSLFHWIRRPNNKNIILTACSIGVSTIFIGQLSMILTFIIGSIFLVTSKLGTPTNWVKFICAQIGAAFLAYSIIFIITGNKNVEIFTFNNLLINIYDTYSSPITFISYIIIALFPWSVPLCISLIWIIKNIQTIRAKFINLYLLQRFGAVIFLISLPTFFFYSRFSLILLLASIFFNSSLIGKSLLTQFNFHTVAWRIIGKCCSSVIGIGICLYILLNTKILAINYPIQFLPHGWGIWNISLLVAITISLYSLWRNKREVHRNNRYFYNIIVLYLLAQNLVIGFIIPNIIYNLNQLA